MRRKNYDICVWTIHRAGVWRRGGDYLWGDETMTTKPTPEAEDYRALIPPEEERDNPIVWFVIGMCAFAGLAVMSVFSVWWMI